MTPAERITKARTGLLLRQPFFGMLLLYLKPVENSDYLTMATDGTHLFFNPNFVQELSDRQLEGVLVHEVLHVILQHIQRLKDRIPVLWNLATDYAVNLIINESGLELPKDVLLDPKYKDMTAEEIYELLLKNANIMHIEIEVDCNGSNSNSKSNKSKGNTKSKKNKKNKGGTLDDHDLWADVANDSSKSDKLGTEWKMRVSNVANAAKQHGNLPAGIKRLIDEILSPSLSWKEILQQYLRPTRADYSFAVPDSRFLLEDYGFPYIPSFIDDNIEDIVIAIDTSGSITDEDLVYFLSEVRGLLSAYPNLRGLLTSCDTTPTDFVELSATTDVKKLPLVGGGGTDFRPVFDLIKKKGINPSLVVYFTDGDGDYPDQPPQYPVLWIMTSKDSVERVPFGRAVFYPPRKKNAA